MNISTIMGEVQKRNPWNKGKRKPIVDEYGNKWCNCLEPNLTYLRLETEPGQAYCLLCHNYWYH